MKSTKSTKLSARKIRTGDKVTVISGSYKGAIGDVISVDGSRAKVEGVNVMVRHKKSAGQEVGTREKINGSIDLSNLAHVDLHDKPVKVRFLIKDGVKYIANKRTLEEIRKV